MISFSVNGSAVEVDVDSQTPLLWVIRDRLRLYGTKFGCGIGACGACTVHLDGHPVRSCSIPVVAAADREVLTIEGLSTDEPHPLQAAWIAEQVPQCGYCQSGMIMAAAALLASDPNPNDDAIATAMTNICRCGTYNRVRKAIRRAAGGEA